MKMLWFRLYLNRWKYRVNEMGEDKGQKQRGIINKERNMQTEETVEGKLRD
jgi:hypothetical protein